MSYIDEVENNPYRAPKADLTFEPTPGFGYAGFGARFVAILIDSILVGVANFFIGFGLGLFLVMAGVDGNVMTIITGLAGLIFGLAYYGGMVSSANQATLGKMAMGIKVTDLNGRRLSFGRAVGRELAKIVSAITFMIGYLMAAFTERKQALHDMIAGTVVVKSR